MSMARRRELQSAAWPKVHDALVPVLTLVWLAAGASLFVRLASPDPVPRASAPPAPSSAEHTRRHRDHWRTVQRLVVFIVDALRADIARDRCIMPTWNEVASRGGAGWHRTGPFPVSASFYKAFFAGRPATLWDVYNDLSPKPRALETWLDALPGAKWFAGPASGHAWLHDVTRPAYVWVLDDMARIPEHDRRAVAAAAALLERPAAQARVVVVHLATLDAIAHRHGARSREYVAAAAAVDQQLAHLLQLCLPQTLTVLVSDHGVRDDGGHSSDGPPEVCWAPFAVAGPVPIAPAASVRIAQSAWPFLMAAWLDIPLPGGYAGKPSMALLAGTAAERGRELLSVYVARLRRAGCPPLARIAARGQRRTLPPANSHDVAALLHDLEARARLWARVGWVLWLLCGVALSCWHVRTVGLSSPRSVLLALSAGVALVALERILPPVGRVDGFAAADALPTFRFATWRSHPLRAAGLFVVCLAAALAWPRRSSTVRPGAVATGVAAATAPLRTRNDLLLYWAAGCLVAQSVRSSLLRWHSRFPPGRLSIRQAGALAALAAIATVGQKLSYEPLAPPWQEVVTAATALGALAVGTAIAVQLARDRRAVIAAGGIAIMALAGIGRFVDPMAARIAWVGLGPLCVAELAGGGLPLATLHAAALLALPCPQQWVIFGSLVWLSRCRIRATDPGSLTLDTTTATGTILAALLAVHLFHFSDGRDTFLPINTLYRGAVGVELADQQFSMLLAAVAVWTRYVVVLVTAGALAGAVVHGHPGRAPFAGLFTLVSVRLLVNASAFAIYGTAAWNYHLALLFNDAMFLSANGAILAALTVAAAMRQRWHKADGYAEQTAAMSTATCSC